jgi:hypothetical protein
MQCEEFEDRLNAVLDERGRPECNAELRVHIEACPECRHLAAIYRALLDGFCALAAPPPPANMAARVLADLPSPSVGARRARLVVTALAIAACLLVAIVPLGRWSSRDDSQIASPARAVSPKQKQPDLAIAANSLGQLTILQSLPALRGDSKADVYGELAKETGDGLAALVLYVPGIGGTRGIIDVEADTDADEPAWAVQMSEGLRPVTDSVTDTLNLLLRALPVTELASRS